MISGSPRRMRPLFRRGAGYRVTAATRATPSRASSVITPLKKPRGGTLLDDEQAANTQLSRHRMPVEHAIGGMKIARIVRDPFRNHADEMSDTVMVVAAGLYNYKCHRRDTMTAN